MRDLQRVALGVLVLASALVVDDEGAARACGCFTPPNPAVTIVQAGERILFSVDGGTVTAYIQIQYQGDAEDFGWLLPLPSIPTLDLGTTELFDKVAYQTRPRYPLDTKRLTCNNVAGSDSVSESGGCGGFASPSYAISDGGSFAATADLASDGANQLVVQDSIGPYDYAVLKADDGKEMLDWLAANHYFVPTGLMDVVGPYLHPGSYFLALRLKSGKSAGDIQPVVVHYASDLPMIPIILTQVGAVPHMGILAWVLGDSRAAPRNYYHAVIDDALLWSNGGMDYAGTVTSAVYNAPKHHAFVTEYAGPASIMHGLFDTAGRFGNPNALRALYDPVEYLRYLKDHGYMQDNGLYTYAYGSTLLAILQTYLPLPKGIDPANAQAYYYNLTTGSKEFPQHLSDAGVEMYGDFDPGPITDEIVKRVVAPVQDAETLFSGNRYLTRLYTTLSPEDMTDDPVFSFNPDLPDVSNIHPATLTIPCSQISFMTTEEGFQFYNSGNLPGLPAALRLETIGVAGPPVVKTDNKDLISQLITSSQGPIVGMPTANSTSSVSSGGSSRGLFGCAVEGRSIRGNVGVLMLAAAALALSRRRRRR